MDQKMVLSAIGVGVGVGVGIGLASGQAVSKWRGNTSSSSDPITANMMEKEMMRMVVDGKDSQVTFDRFPYYLRGCFLYANFNNSEQTRVLLTSAAYIHLKHADISKFTRNLSPASRAILLSGPAESFRHLQEEKRAMDAKGQESGDDVVVKEAGPDPNEPEVILRPLTMEDFKQAKDQVAASYAAEGASMAELKQWNDLYGEGSSRRKQQLTYFL